MRRALLLGCLLACSSSETTTSSAATDGGSADASDASDASTTPNDAGAEASTGETCIGYGAGETCETEQGTPYGYVCFGGAPPGVEGCKLTRESASIGNNYCCTENVCVEQIDQGAQCNGVSGKPRRFQCPPTDTGNATPPAGCVEHDSGSSDVEKYYCCP